MQVMREIVKIGLVLAGIILLSYAALKMSYALYGVEYHNQAFDVLQNFKRYDGIKVIVLATNTDCGGKATAILGQVQALHDADVPTLLVSTQGSGITRLADKRKIAYCLLHPFFFASRLGNWIASSCSTKNLLKEFMSTHGTIIIHCNSQQEVAVARRIARLHARVCANVRVVYTHHEAVPIKSRIIQSVNALVPVSPHVCAQTCALLHNANTDEPLCVHIPPFFLPDAFIQYESLYESRAEWFKKRFNIELDDQLPLLCMIAQFYKHVDCKNHPLLFEALRIVINEYQRPVYLVLAGSGHEKPPYHELIAEKNLQKYVFFLGEIEDVAPLLAHIDMSLLTSNGDAFSISAIESGLMRKPFIASSGVGSAGNLIIDGQTGLVFEKGNARACADCIIKLLDNPDLGAKLGAALHTKIMQEYTPQALCKRLLDVYHAVADRTCLVDEGNKKMSIV